MFFDGRHKEKFDLQESPSDRSKQQIPESMPFLLFLLSVNRIVTGNHGAYFFT